MKRNINKVDFIKIKNFCSLKYPVKRMRREAGEWERILRSHVFNKGLVSRIYKELLRINCKKNKQFN